jgi:hypothetical protein
MEESVMRNMKKLVCMGMVYLMLSPIVAFSQGNGGGSNCAAPKAPTLPSDLSKPITREYAAESAKFLLPEELCAQKLTLQQATDYTFCVYRKYGEHIKEYRKTEESREFFRLVDKRLELGKNMSAQDRAKLDALEDKTTNSINGLQDQSESACSKELGLTVPRGKIFGGHFRQR